MPKISLVIPVYNEESIISHLYRRCTDSMEKMGEPYEIICVNDGSKDQTLPKLIEFHKLDHRFKVISLSRNFGHQAAILAGLTVATGDFIGIIDGDLQDPPEILKDFATRLEEGFDVVFAVRKKRKENFIKRFVYWSYYRILKGMSNIDIPLDSGDFCMMRKVVKDYIVNYPEHSLFIRGMRSWVGFRQTGLEYERDKRHSGEPKYTLKKLIRLAINGLFGFSRFPIRFISILGLSTIIFSFIYIGITLVKKFFFNDVPEGFTTLIIFITLFSGVQLLSIGLIGEYIQRIYDESRKRPLFIIQNQFLED